MTIPDDYTSGIVKMDSNRYADTPCALCCPTSASQTLQSLQNGSYPASASSAAVPAVQVCHPFPAPCAAHWIGPTAGWEIRHACNRSRSWLVSWAQHAFADASAGTMVQCLLAHVPGCALQNRLSSTPVLVMYFDPPAPPPRAHAIWPPCPEHVP